MRERLRSRIKHWYSVRQSKTKAKTKACVTRKIEIRTNEPNERFKHTHTWNESSCQNFQGFATKTQIFVKEVALSKTIEEGINQFRKSRLQCHLTEKVYVIGKNHLSFEK